MALALAPALAGTPGNAQEGEMCPHPPEWRPSPEELRATLRAHKEWYDTTRWSNPAGPGGAILCNADLREADLQGAFLAVADLRGANLFEANLAGADLGLARLQGATLIGANLADARLPGARLQDAHLHSTNLAGADLIGVSFKGANLFKADLRGADLQSAILAGANLFRANLAGANLDGANLAGTTLGGANLAGADLSGANLRGASLAGAHLQGADLSGANLAGTLLRNSILHDADLSEVDVADAKLAYADLSGATYAPASPPPNDYSEGIKGLDTVRVPYDDGTAQANVSGLVQLREVLQKAGLRGLERKATYAIEHNKTYHALARWREDPLAAVLAVLRLALVEWTTGYGLYPFFAIFLLLVFIGAFALIYLVPLSMPGAGAIHCVWPEGRLERKGGTSRLIGRTKVEQFRPRNPLAVLGRALQFSVLSAFHLGWRDLNVGTWLARVQTREYTLRPTGWVRAFAGVQSLLSVYLLALWALTYFGRPFQ